MISPYATALYDLASEAKQLDEYQQITQAVLSGLKENPEYLALLDHPGWSEEEKLKAIQEAFPFFDTTLHFFFKILVEDHQIRQAEQILEDFDELVDRFNGIETALVSSAIALDEEELASLKTALEKKHGIRLKLKTEVNPDLIGGLRIQIGEEVIDHTLKTKLMRLKEQLH